MEKRSEIEVFLRYREKVVPLQVNIGEPFNFFVNSAVKLHFSDVKEFKVYHGSEEVPGNVKVEESHRGKEFAILIERKLTVLTPFQQTINCTLFETDTVQNLLNLAAFKFGVSTKDVHVFQHEKRCDAEMSITSLSSERVDVCIKPLYPTLYVVEDYKVKQVISWWQKLDLIKVKKGFCAKEKVAEDRVVLLMNGKRAEEEITFTDVCLVFAVRVPPGAITVLIQHMEKPEIAVDLMLTMTETEAMNVIAGKLRKEVEQLRFIFNGKTIGDGTVAESGIGHGARIWVIPRSNKKTLIVKSEISTIGIDLLPTDTIATFKSLFSSKAKISVVQFTVFFNKELLSDASIIPADFFTTPTSLRIEIYPRIYIRKLSGLVSKFTAQGNVTVQELKAKLVALKMIDSERCSLKMRGLEVNSGMRVIDANIRDKCILDADCF